MRRIGFLIEKEFKQIGRNTVLLRMMIAAPVLQLIMLTYAANFEVKNINLVVVDEDHTTFSQRLISKFTCITNFHLIENAPSYKHAYETMVNGKTDLILVIPPHFDQDLVKGGLGSLQLEVSAIDGSKANIAMGYAQNIIRDFGYEILVEMAPEVNTTSPITPISQYWYNPRLEYKTFMVPAILFELLILVGGLISALNIVREKEIGTQEQINVTPIRKVEFIIGKLTPFVIIGMVQFTIGLLVGVFLFDIPMLGDIFLVYGFALLFSILCAALGLLISAIFDTQQQAMFAIFFFLVLFILLSGLFSSTENMPEWAQIVDIFNPIKYIIEVGRNVILKGSTWADMQSQFWILVAMAVSLMGLASWRYKKTV